jgi:hypothetical protein
MEARQHPPCVVDLPGVLDGEQLAFDDREDPHEEAVAR